MEYSIVCLCLLASCFFTHSNDVQIPGVETGEKRTREVSMGVPIRGLAHDRKAHSFIPQTPRAIALRGAMEKTKEEIATLQQELNTLKNAEKQAKLNSLIATKKEEFLKRQFDWEDELARIQEAGSAATQEEKKLQKDIRKKRQEKALLELRLRESTKVEEQNKIRNDIASQQKQLKELDQRLEDVRRKAASQGMPRRNRGDKESRYTNMVPR